MFEQAAELSPSGIKAYRNFAFTDTISNPGNDPFFSVDNAVFWISSLGYKLYFLENPDIWINPIAFQAYMDSTQDPVVRNSTPATSRAPSRATSSISMAESRASSRISFIPSSWPSSPVSYASSDMLSRPSSSISVEVIEIHDSDSDDPGSVAIPAARSTASSGNPFVPPLPKVEVVDLSISLSSPPPATVPDTKPERKKKGKGKGKLQQQQQIAITRQEKVDHIVHSTSVPTTYDVPRAPTALLVDLSSSVELLRIPDGRIVSLDTFIRAQNHESWDGGAGHTAGDFNVAGFTSNFSEKIRCRRCHLTCNGIDTCEFFEEEICDGLERYEADEQGMQELWDRALDQNEEEAASTPGIICRYPLAPQDIDLTLNEGNILAGKRKRTKSTRAIEGTAAPGPSKKLSRHGLFYSAGQWCDKLFIRYGKWTARLFASLWHVFPSRTADGLVSATPTPTVRLLYRQCDWTSRTRTLPVYTQNRTCNGIGVTWSLPHGEGYLSLALSDIPECTGGESNPNSPFSNAASRLFGRRVQTLHSRTSARLSTLDLLDFEPRDEAKPSDPLQTRRGLDSKATA
ncbi:hypothetical protein K438DRAFT_2171413 [Mycena galopus ATCC 62051]|nr:hypothetical protein K438DRAFT_2171413 [Mycena galopus ATCC 62051]